MRVWVGVRPARGGVFPSLSLLITSFWAAYSIDTHGLCVCGAHMCGMYVQYVSVGCMCGMYVWSLGPLSYCPITTCTQPLRSFSLPIPPVCGVREQCGEQCEEQCGRCVCVCMCGSAAPPFIRPRSVTCSSPLFRPTTCSAQPNNTPFYNSYSQYQCLWGHILFYP